MTPEQAEVWIGRLSDDLGCPRPNHRVDDSDERPCVKPYAGCYEVETQTIVSVRYKVGDAEPVGQLTLLRYFAEHLHHMRGHSGDCTCGKDVDEAVQRLRLFEAE